LSDIRGIQYALEGIKGGVLRIEAKHYSALCTGGISLSSGFRGSSMD